MDVVKEDELPYPIDYEIIDHPQGEWFLVYDSSEPGQPHVYAIKAYDADTADSTWAEQEANRDTDPGELLVVVRLERA